MNKTRYLLLPDLNKDGECEMVNVLHIEAIEKIEAGEEEYVDEETGDSYLRPFSERCVVTVSPVSNCNKNWRDKAHDILVPLSTFELLQLINSNASYHTEDE